MVHFLSKRTTPTINNKQLQGRGREGIVVVVCLLSSVTIGVILLEWSIGYGL